MFHEVYEPMFAMKADSGAFRRRTSIRTPLIVATT
jgi:hypothetical protein